MRAGISRAYVDGMVSSRISQAAASSGLTMAQIAARIGCHPNSLLNWCSGRFSPSIEYIPSICTALKISSDWLLGLSDDEM